MIEIHKIHPCVVQYQFTPIHAFDESQRLICDSACAVQVDVIAVTSLLMAKRPCDEAGVATYEGRAIYFTRRVIHSSVLDPG